MRCSVGLSGRPGGLSGWPLANSSLGPSCQPEGGRPGRPTQWPLCTRPPPNSADQAPGCMPGQIHRGNVIMKDGGRNTVSLELGVTPYPIHASNCLPCERSRYYWTDVISHQVLARPSCITLITVWSDSHRLAHHWYPTPVGSCTRPHRAPGVLASLLHHHLLDPRSPIGSAPCK